MSPTAEQSRRELLALLEQGMPAPEPLRVPHEAHTRSRRSSVLILFGVLDQAPASECVPTVPSGLDVLLIRRSEALRHHPGEIAFPGGGVEPDDADATATALREATEETGLDPRGVEVLGSLPEVLIPVSRNLVTPVIGWWSLPSRTAADHSESVQVFRTPVAELLDPGARVTSVLHRGGAEYRGPAFMLSQRFGGHLLWGFTGMMLSQMFEELGWAVPWDPAREQPVV